MTIAAQRAEAQRLRSAFEAAGGQPVECSILQPAELFLDLYGEDIRARAYVTQDPGRGEQMLRPDFTLPVVQMHMSQGAETGRYTYSGEVFRRQEDHPERASEYLQVGYEVFDGNDPAAVDAEVFALFSDVLRPFGLRASTGDMGILLAAVRGLETSERRRAALLRHIWRPKRFRALIDRFSGRAPVPPSRAALLATEDPMAGVATMIGLRSAQEIEARIDALRQDAAEPPLSAGQVALIDAVLAVRETCVFALEHLRDISVDMPAIGEAVERFAQRSEAMYRRGVDVASLDFEAAYGRTSMEYYDGFVFGFYAEARPDLPPVATGGRYDALTRRLGSGASAPAVGGVIRPDIICALESRS